jgi:3-oxoacyl-[acyl-carrier protein] reductase
MIDDLRDKVVLITGASTGIGAAAAQAFGANAARVVVHYNRSREEAERVAAAVERSGGRALLAGGDVTQPAAIEELVSATIRAFGRIDVLVNNAGGLVKRVPIAEVTDELFEEVVRLNVWSVMALCRAVVPHLRRQGGGSIINVSSVAARHGGGPGASLYAGAKGFVSTMTRGLAKELVNDRIRVNAVAPGVIETPFHDRYSTPDQMRAMAATIPMGRVGTADEVAGAFLFLASEALSGYVTGQVLEVNGGSLMP